MKRCFVEWVCTAVAEPGKTWAWPVGGPLQTDMSRPTWLPDIYKARNRTSVNAKCVP